MAINPSSRRFAQLFTAAISAGSSPGSAPALASSGDSFTSSITSSGLPDASRRRASFSVSTVWMVWNNSAARFALFDCKCPIR